MNCRSFVQGQSVFWEPQVLAIGNNQSDWKLTVGLFRQEKATFPKECHHYTRGDWLHFSHRLQFKWIGSSRRILSLGEFLIFLELKLPSLMNHPLRDFFSQLLQFFKVLKFLSACFFLGSGVPIVGTVMYATTSNDTPSTGRHYFRKCWLAKRKALALASKLYPELKISPL